MSSTKAPHPLGIRRFHTSGSAVSPQGHSSHHKSLDQPTYHISSVCHICHDHEVQFWAVTECNHQSCLKCAIRLRLLYENPACALCKRNSTRIFATADPCKTNFVSTELLDKDIFYESIQAKQFVDSLLEQQCPVCPKVFKDRPGIRRHLINDHKLFVCECCFQYKKGAFSKELQTYNTRRDMLNHQRDIANGGHPLCPACNVMFYGEDELGNHCRTKHELCHLCDRARKQVPIPANLSLEERRQTEMERIAKFATLANAPYYQDYATLETHFAKMHHLCLDPMCKELKFVVFAEELELRAHQAEMHSQQPSGAGVRMQRSQQQQLRRIDVVFGSEERRPVTRPTSQIIKHEPNRGRDANTHAPVENVHIAPATTHAMTIYGPIGELCKRLQSIHLLEARNEDLMKDLRAELSTNQLRSLEQACQSFQAGRMPPDDLIKRFEQVFGLESLRKAQKALSSISGMQSIKPTSLTPMLTPSWMPIKKASQSDEDTQSSVAENAQFSLSETGGIVGRLVDLMPDEEKKRHLQHAIQMHLHKADSFPTLPLSKNESKGTRNESVHSKSTTRSFESVQLPFSGGKVLRIVKDKPIKGAMPLDPTKNPSCLSGGIGSGIRRTDMNMPSKIKKSAPKRSEESKNTLGKPLYTPVTMSSLINAANPADVKEYQDDTFVIGGEQSSKNEEKQSLSYNDQTVTMTKKKPTRTVLMSTTMHRH